MTTMLKQVLMLFETSSRPLSLLEMSYELGIQQNMLEGMIEYWVRKGKIRAAGGEAEQCVLCGIKGQCPFVAKSPRRYELVTSSTPPAGSQPPCSCCS